MHDVPSGHPPSHDRRQRLTGPPCVWAVIHTWWGPQYSMPNGDSASPHGVPRRVDPLAGFPPCSSSSGNGRTSGPAGVQDKRHAASSARGASRRTKQDEPMPRRRERCSFRDMGSRSFNAAAARSVGPAGSAGRRQERVYRAWASDVQWRRRPTLRIGSSSVGNSRTRMSREGRSRALSG